MVVKCLMVVVVLAIVGLMARIARDEHPALWILAGLGDLAIGVAKFAAHLVAFAVLVVVAILIGPYLMRAELRRFVTEWRDLIVWAVRRRKSA